MRLCITEDQFIEASNSQITQSETPQTPSPNPTVSIPLYMYNPLKKYQVMQKQSSNTKKILLVHIHIILLWKVFNGFLMAGNWKKKKKKHVSFDEIFVGKIRSIIKNSGKKEHSNVDLWGKVSTTKSDLNYALSRLILAWIIFCSFHRSWVYLRNIIDKKKIIKFSIHKIKFDRNENGWQKKENNEISNFSHVFFSLNKKMKQ